MDSTQIIEQAKVRAHQQINAARVRAERDLERATEKANRVLAKGNQAARQHPGILGAILGTVILGGIAAWLFSSQSNSSDTDRPH